jgi:hypothetical protein
VSTLACYERILLFSSRCAMWATNTIAMRQSAKQTVCPRLKARGIANCSFAFVPRWINDCCRKVILRHKKTCEYSSLTTPLYNILHGDAVLFHIVINSGLYQRINISFCIILFVVFVRHPTSINTEAMWTMLDQHWFCSSSGRRFVYDRHDIAERAEYRDNLGLLKDLKCD